MPTICCRASFNFWPPRRTLMAWGAALQRTGRCYVPWFNARHGRSGSLFAGRFKTSVVEAEPFLLQCSQYIELCTYT